MRDQQYYLEAIEDFGAVNVTGHKDDEIVKQLLESKQVKLLSNHGIHGLDILITYS